MTDTITCLLCQGVIGFNEHDQSRYKSHLSFEHKAFYYVPWLIAKTIEECEKKPMGAFEREEVNNRQNVSVKPVGGFEREEENNSQKVSVSITKKEVTDFLNNMNLSDLLLGDKNDCIICNKSFASTKSLRKHLLNKHGRSFKHNSKPYPCSVCDKSFKTKSYVEVHEKKHANAGETVDSSSVNIEEGLSETADSSSLDMSMEEDRDGIKKEVKYVPEELLVEDEAVDISGNHSLLEDYSLLEDKSGSISVQMKSKKECTLCNKTFSSKSHLKRHLMIHSRNPKNPKPYQFSGEEVSMEEACADVKKEVTDVLDKMNPVKLLGNNLVCTLCDENSSKRNHFSSKRNFKRHLEKRHGRNPKDPKHKPYQCSVCDKSFKTKSYVEIHEKIHAGEIADIEEELSETADSSSVNIQEELSETTNDTSVDIQEFQCVECPKVFISELYMKTHQKSHTLDLAHININLAV